MAIKGDEEPDFDIRKWVHNKLFVDKHLIGFDLRFLNDFFENKENVSKEIANEIKEYRKNATENSKKDPVFTALLLQQACIELAEAKPKDLVKYLKKVEAILEKGVLFDGRFNEFLNDIRGMVDSEKNSKRTATEGFKVVFTDDPIDLLLCGTDVTDSCQRVEGDPQNNKGLLGYLMDGKNRLLAVKDPSGKIVARCLLNVMWDGQEPVLYRERFYPSNLSAKHQQGLNELAKQVARSMKLTLTSEEGDKPYGKELQALGGPAPYEYSDGAGGLQGDGEYAIPEAFIVSFDNDN
jgi:hypothetical protein